MADEFNDFGDVFPLISAWGMAVENNKDATAQLEALRRVKAVNAPLLKNAIKEAIEIQGLFAQYPRPQDRAIAADSPKHPRQRQTRVRNLLKLLEFEP